MSARSYYNMIHPYTPYKEPEEPEVQQPPDTTGIETALGAIKSTAKISKLYDTSQDLRLQTLNLFEDPNLTFDTGGFTPDNILQHRGSDKLPIARRFDKVGKRVQLNPKIEKHFSETGEFPAGTSPEEITTSLKGKGATNDEIANIFGYKDAAAHATANLLDSKRKLQDVQWRAQMDANQERLSQAFQGQTPIPGGPTGPFDMKPDIGLKGPSYDKLSKLNIKSPASPMERNLNFGGPASTYRGNIPEPSIGMKLKDGSMLDKKLLEKMKQPTKKFTPVEKKTILPYDPLKKPQGTGLGSQWKPKGTIGQSIKQAIIPQKGVAQGPGMQIAKAVGNIGKGGLKGLLAPKLAAQQAATAAASTGTAAATGVAANTGLMAGLGPAGWAMMAMSLLGGKLFKKHTLLGKLFSDKRLKKNIKYVDKSLTGTPIVEFEYKDEMKIPGRYRGVLSEDVPHATSVHPSYGYEMVDYDKIDVEFERIN